MGAMALALTAAGGFLGSHRSTGALAAVFAVVLAGVAASDPPSANDVFAGRIEHGTGAYRAAQGTVGIVISLGAATTTFGSRALTLTFAGKPCVREGTDCVVLDGIVHGRATQRNRIPDLGALLHLRGRGKVGPLRRVRITGTVHGTGFIVSGHETMSLSIGGRRGTLVVKAKSNLVPGFTSP
jgi:hypothetical protein